METPENSCYCGGCLSQYFRLGSDVARWRHLKIVVIEVGVFRNILDQGVMLQDGNT